MQQFKRRPPAHRYDSRHMFDRFSMADDDAQLRSILEATVRELEEQTIAERELVCYALRDGADPEEVIGETLEEQDATALLLSEMEVLVDDGALEQRAFGRALEQREDDGDDLYGERIEADYDAEYDDDADTAADKDADTDEAEVDEKRDGGDAAGNDRRRRSRTTPPPPAPPQRPKRPSQTASTARAKPKSKRR